MKMKNNIVDTPEFAKELIIYEIATKSFTSPAGPESGGYASLAEKMEYLRELGINGIWLAGHQLCDENHFYNIWTEYACIRPDVLDPSLGTEEEFRNMVECAHEKGIRVFLDVITHGVMSGSPLVKEHPDWFKSGSWGMDDYDWYGNHEDLDEWWMNTWVGYVKQYGVDGYRLDVAHYRNDLWAEIRRRTKELGKEILIIAETGPAIKGVTDIIQQGEILGYNFGRNPSIRLVRDAAGYCSDRCKRNDEHYEVEITYEDGTIQTSKADNWYQPLPTLQVIQEKGCKKDQMCSPYEAEYISHTGRLRIENAYRKKSIRNIVIEDKESHKWNLLLSEVLEVDYKVEYQWENSSLFVEFPLRIQDGQYLSFQVSCHDNGWDGFPQDENPYTIRGSRCLFGYSALLAPGIPIFMAGEEFNADYRPLPNLSPDLYGKDKETRGKWLYGSWINWDQLKDERKQQMLEDVKSLIHIRRNYAHLIVPYCMGQTEKHCFPLDGEWEEEIPIPYIYPSKDKNEALVVMGNSYSDKECVLKLDFSGYVEREESYSMQVLFGTGENISIRGQQLNEREWTILRDNSPGGGLLVLHLKREEGESK